MQKRSTLKAYESKKRGVRIMAMHAAGHTLKEIAAKEGISFQAVHKRIAKAVRKVEAQGEFETQKVKLRQNLRLHELVKNLFPEALDLKLDAVRELLKTEKLIAEINGTIAPKKFANSEGDDLFSTFIETVENLHKP